MNSMTLSLRGNAVLFILMTVALAALPRPVRPLNADRDGGLMFHVSSGLESDSDGKLWANHLKEFEVRLVRSKVTTATAATTSCGEFSCACCDCRLMGPENGPDWGGEWPVEFFGLTFMECAARNISNP